ncbi:DUF2145 domain-containing protein [Caldimonas sp. KR1-144]|uniref:DUF2145 domain-containing protein n=1 Tax=Caldimonas sp. KR1-144 TaxID=3400911 RepID=UPI003BFD9B65
MIAHLARAALLAAALLASAAPAQAASAALRFCDRGPSMTATEQDRLLRFAALVKEELDGAGDAVALVSRSGLNLQRFGLRYSHAGIGLKPAGDGAAGWAVRQLYYACSEGRPRLYDQGLAGFVSGTENPATGYISIVLLPKALAEPLAAAARDNALALSLLAGRYSANAFPFSLRYQNCNQWVMELIAAAWGRTGGSGLQARERAQAWLQAQDYDPEPVRVDSHLLMFASAFVPWVHADDHPEEDWFKLQVRTSVPREIEAFVRRRAPAARRVELCHDERRVVVRHGWQPLGDGCEPQAGDRVVPLD